jgi:hypothetical protein
VQFLLFQLPTCALDLNAFRHTWEIRAGDWLRIVPEAPLDPRRQYRLMLDAHTEFPLRLAGSSEPAIAGVALTVTPKTLQLIRPEGMAVTYFPVWPWMGLS